MSEPVYYLRPNVQVEPLFNQWYAWPLLISPHTAAMHVANSHLKIMKSYVAAPQVHANAVKNPAMLGGPFIDYGGKRVDEIRSLVAKTTKEQQHMIAFAEAVNSLDDLLGSEANGYSLEPLYPKIPGPLRGYVELVYDLNNNPSIRYLEGMLYRSPYYDPSRQSLALSLTEQDGRPFALSTPRLPDAESVTLDIPFADGAVDELFATKETPRPLPYLAERLNLGPEQAALFRRFLTEESPPPRLRFDAEGVRVRYYGHACVLLETREVSILIDPAISYKYDSGIDRFTFEDLPDVIDYVVITHSHQDHAMFESLLQLRYKVKHLLLPRSRGNCMEDPCLRMMFQHVGFKSVRQLDEMETFEVEGGSITGLPFFGEHCDLNITTKMAHLIRLKNRSFLFAADSNNIEPALYEHLHAMVGDVEVLYLGMECDGAPMSWLYGPLLTKPLDRKVDQSRRLSGSDSEKGFGIVERFNCKEVYVYAMGQEEWLTYALSLKYTEESKQIVHSNRLVAECRSRGINSERLYGKKETVYAPAP